MLVLHVGPHKTATTWIQSNLHHNAGRLEQLGWHYPATGQRVAIAHHDLSDKPREILKRGSRKVAEFEKIAAKARESGLNIVLSSEGFRHWQPAHIRRLKEIMSGHEIRIVYGLRDPVSLLYSFWAQQVKSGMTHSLPEFIARQEQAQTRVTLLDPRAEIARFASIADNGLTILAYDEIRRSNHDIFDLFCTDVLGIDVLPHAESSAVNEREPVELTEFMRLVMKHHDRWSRKGNVKIGTLFRFMMTEGKKQQIIDTVAAVASARRILRVERNTPQLQAIEAHILQEFGDCLVPRTLHEHLFLRETAAFDYYDEEALLAVPAVAKLVEDMAASLGPGSLRMFIVDWSRFWMITGRRVLNFFR